MNDHSTEISRAFRDLMAGPRLPRVALMGEFSAGKSTLANLMVGTDPLPMQVVATQLPPVLMSYGDAPPVLIDVEGHETPCDLSARAALDLDTTAMIRVFCQEEILRRCNIIDMPGLSDPNMSSEVWERVLPLADAVVWCSPATQAWRQSEAAVWDTMRPSLQANALLLLTRSDMLVTERDRARVLKRVQKETVGLFASVQLISLLQARDAEDDEALWHSCGADRFVTDFLDLIARVAKELGLSCDPDECLSGADAVEVEPPGKEEQIARGHIVPRRPVSNKQASAEADPETPDLSSITPKFS